MRIVPVGSSLPSESKLKHMRRAKVYASADQKIFVVMYKMGEYEHMYIGPRDNLEVQGISHTKRYKDGGTSVYQTSDGYIFRHAARNFRAAEPHTLYIFDKDTTIELSEAISARYNPETGNVYLLPV